MKLRFSHPPLSSFSLASLTDIVLLLLVFFLLASTYVIQPGIKVELPSSETAQVVDQKSIIITITRDGAVWVGDEKTTLDGVGALLRRQIISGTAQTIVIKADRTVSLETAVKVIDRIKAAGGERFLIATVREEP
ncbi:MAG: biopolymer transporter ExbD [Calditrichaeota bacterium]|nr:biopolymer transporter ExbD [Calditrichota bacterium]